MIEPRQRRPFFGSVLLMSPGLLIPAAATAVSLPVLVRLMSPEEFGLHGLAIALLFSMQVVTNGWLVTATIRYRSVATIELEKRCLESILTTLVLGSSVASSAMMLVVMSLLSLFDVTVSAVFWLLPLQLCALNLATFQAQNARADLNIARFNLVSLARGVLGPMLGLLAVMWVSRTAFSFAGGATLGWVLAAAGASRSVRPAPLGRILTDPLGWRVVRFGAPLVPTYAFTQGLDVGDRFMLALLEGKAAAAVYTAAYSGTIGGFQMLLLLVSSAAGPSLVRVWRADKTGASSRVKDLLLLCLVLGLPLVLLSGLESESMDVVFGGSTGTGGGIALLALSGAGLALLAQWVAQRPLVHEERTKIVMFVYGACLLINLALNSVAIPLFGVQGAAVSTALSNVALLFGIGTRGSGVQEWWPGVSRALAVAVPALTVGGVASIMLGDPERPALDTALARLSLVGLASLAAGSAALLAVTGRWCRWPRAAMRS